MNKKLENYLVESGNLSKDQLAEALKQMEHGGGRLDRFLIKRGYVNEEVILKFFANETNLPFMLSSELKELPDSAINAVPRALVVGHRLIPLKKTKDELTVLIDDPTNVSFEEELKLLFGGSIRIILCSEPAMSSLLNRYFYAK